MNFYVYDKSYPYIYNFLKTEPKKHSVCYKYLTENQYLNLKEVCLEVFSVYEKDAYPGTLNLVFNCRKTSLNKEANILHYMPHTNDKEFSVYRRFKLRKFLLKNCEIDGVSELDFSEELFNKKYDIIFCSTCHHTFPLVAKAKHDKSLLVYDRTDNWSALKDKLKNEEELLIQHADMIFCSSKYLFDSLPECFKQKAFLIENGCEIKPFVKTEKYSKKTAVYAGRSVSKVDISLLNELAKKNTDWDIKVFASGDKNEKLSEKILFHTFINEEDLHKELCKCHVGLIPFVSNGYTKGMLPLKLFNYANAHLPVLYSNCDNCKNFDFAFPIENYSLNDLLNVSFDFDFYLKDYGWHKKFEYMLEKIKEFNIENKK